MPLFLTHIYKLKENNFFNVYSSEEYNNILLGNILPDIRYLIKEKRNYTHFFDDFLVGEDYSWQKVSANVNKHLTSYQNVEFKNGYASHIFLDILWDKIISPSYLDKYDELSDKIVLELLLVPMIDVSHVDGLSKIFCNIKFTNYTEQQLKEWLNFVNKYFEALFSGQKDYLFFLEQQTIVAIPNIEQLLALVLFKLNNQDSIIKVEKILNNKIFQAIK